MTNDELEALAVRCEDGEALREAIDVLRAQEGWSVEFIHDNPELDGPNCAVRTTVFFGEKYDTFFGPTVEQCLAAAIRAMKDSQP